MPKRISITLLVTLLVAIVALFAGTDVTAECTQDELASYECFVDDQGYFEVRIQKPFPLYDADTDKSTYTWSITKLNSPHDASHFDLIIEREFEDKIVGGGLLDCDGSGDPSTGYAKYLTWNCYYKWDNLSGNHITINLTINGKFGSAPSDYFIKTGGEPAWGIIQAPAPFCVSVLGPYTPSSTTDIVTIKTKQIKILRNPKTGCGIGLEESSDGEIWHTVLPLVELPVVGTTPVVDCGTITGNSGCSQECIVTAAESPGWTYINLGGTWYKVYIE